jgi:hypothetical protein
MGLIPGRRRVVLYPLREAMTNEPIDVQVVHYDKQGVTLEYSVYSHHVAFRAREGTKAYFGGDGVQEFADNFEKAERFIDGEIKWDGCSHIYFGDKTGYIHLCGGHSFLHMEFVLREMFRIAAEKMPEWDADVAGADAYLSSTSRAGLQDSESSPNSTGPAAPRLTDRA